MLSTLYLPLVLLAAVVGTGLALFAWLHRETPGAGPLSLFSLSASLLAITEGLSLATPGTNTIYWATLSYAITAIIPLAWLLTVIEYTGREHWLTRRRVAVLLVEPVVYSVLLWTNDSHHLVWTDADVAFVDPYTSFVATEEIAFWGHMVYAYLLVAIGAAVLLRVLLHSDGLFRAQSTALLAAIAVPMIVNALYVFELLGLTVDPTGVAFVLSGGIIAAAILRDQFLDISPAARELGREELVAQLEDGVFIVDSTGTIVDINRAAEDLLEADRSSVVGQPLGAVRPELAAVVEEGTGVAEVTLTRDGLERYYDVRISPLHRAYGAVTGHIVSLRDVTQRTRREQRLDVMNRLFRHNLRNEMNVVRGNAELLADALDPPRETRAERIIRTVDEVIDRSDKVGSLSRSLDTDSPGRTVDIERILQSAVEECRATHPVDTTIAVADDRESWAVTAGPAIEVAVLELLENAAEHGATDGDDSPVSIDVSLTAVDAETIELAISDDGPGIPRQERAVIQEGAETPLQHGSGIGLWMVTWLVERVGGSIEFGVTDAGTTATMRLRVADETATS